MKKKDVSLVAWIIMLWPVILTGVICRNIRMAYVFGTGLTSEMWKGF